MTKFNDKQIEAINSIEGTVQVIAAAGSGKSSILVERVLNMINHKYSIHLKKMEANKEGSFYKQYENKNPFTQYTSESAILYEELLLQIGYDSIVRIFKVIEQYANEIRLRNSQPYFV